MGEKAFEWSINADGGAIRARAKPLPRKSGSHLAANDGGESVSGQANTAHRSGTVGVRSTVRMISVPEAREVFEVACKAAGVSVPDIAAAVDVTPNVIRRWLDGTSSIPSDCAWVICRRLPALGEEILIRCFERLPPKHRASLLQRAAALG